MTILVTRPEPAALRTAEYLRTLKFSPFILPLSKTIGLPVDSRQLKGDVLIVTSEAVFSHVEGTILRRLREKRLYCVGLRTAEAAHTAGFNNITYIASNIDELAASINCSADTKLLYLAGRVRRPEFESLLAEKFQNISVVEVYNTEPVFLTKKDKAKIPKKIDVIMLYSAMAAAGLTQIEQYMNKSTVLLCLSARIAQAIPKTILNTQIIAYQPNEEAMLNDLQAILA